MLLVLECFAVLNGEFYLLKKKYDFAYVASASLKARVKILNLKTWTKGGKVPIFRMNLK